MSPQRAWASGGGLSAQAFYLTSAQITNIRGFKNLELSFLDEQKRPRRRTVIIGPNGTCKTTLLRCLALGLSQVSLATGLLNEENGRFVRDGVARGTISISVKPARGPRVEYKIRRSIRPAASGESITPVRGYEELDRQLFVCGYGAGRSNAQGTGSRRNYRVDDSVYTLFNYESPLNDPELTLRRLSDFVNQKIYNRVLAALKLALRLTPEDDISIPRGGGVQISGPSVPGKVPLEAWADGYKLQLYTLLDVFAWAMRAGRISETGRITGILLIDEIEQHLHPSLQMSAIDNLSHLFPDMQLIVTTHSPIVLQGVDPSEVVALRRDGNEVHGNTNLPDFVGYSYEDVLVQLFFTPPHGQILDGRLRRWQELVAIPSESRNRSQKIEIQKLSGWIQTSRPPDDSDDPVLIGLQSLMEKLAGE